MPPVIQGLYALGSYLIGSFSGAKALAFVFKLAVSMAASYALNKLLAPKLPKDSIGSNPLQMTRNPIAPRRVIYGTGRYSGPIVFANVSGAKNERLHFIVVLAGHECEEIGNTFWFDDKQFEVPFPGNSTSHAEYADVLLLNKHRGQAGDTADGQLITDCPSVWTSAHKLEGCAYVMVRLYWEPEVFPGGIPNVTALVRGKKCYDPRDSVTRWTQNPALCLRDYLTDTVYGMGADSTEIDDDSFEAAANICDESVGVATSFTRDCDITEDDREIVCADTSGMFAGLAVSGTGIPAGATIESVDVLGAFFTLSVDPSASGSDVELTFGDTEPRYLMNGSFETDAQPATVIEYILNSMAGSLVYVGGQWRVKAGAYEAPTITLDEDDMRGGISVQTKDSIADACNGVKGTFANPAENYQMTDFAPWQSAAAVGEDGDVEIWRDVTMPFVTSHSQAQRLAKIEVMRSRFGITAQLQCKLSALRVQAGDTVGITNTRLGWTNKAFVVTSFSFAVEDDGTVGCDLTVREASSTVFDWTPTGEDGEETPYDPSPDPDVPDFPDDPDPDYEDLVYGYPVEGVGLECRFRPGIEGVFSSEAGGTAGGHTVAATAVASYSGGWSVALRLTLDGPGGASSRLLNEANNCASLMGWLITLYAPGTGTANDLSYSGGTGGLPVNYNLCVNLDQLAEQLELCLPATGGWSGWVAVDGEETCEDACVAKLDSDTGSCDNQDAEFKITASGLDADKSYYFSVSVMRQAIGAVDSWGIYEFLDGVATTDGAGDLEYIGDVPQLVGWQTCVREPKLWGSVAL
jgi:hypothetical protein